MFLINEEQQAQSRHAVLTAAPLSHKLTITYLHFSESEIHEVYTDFVG